MHPFRAFISSHTQISDQEWKKIHSYLTHRIVQENRVILKQGAICEDLYFLENGLIQFSTAIQNIEISNYQIQPPFLFTSVQSFTKQIPSKETIQAVEESHLWVISRENVLKLLEMPVWNDFISKM